MEIFNPNIQELSRLKIARVQPVQITTCANKLAQRGENFYSTRFAHCISIKE